MIIHKFFKPSSLAPFLPENPIRKKYGFKKGEILKMAKRITFGINDRGIRLGEAHHNAKLTDAEVDQIRDLHENGAMGYKMIAHNYSVHRNTVKDICDFKHRATTPADYRTIIVAETTATFRVEPDWRPRMSLPPADPAFFFEDDDLFFA